MAYTNKDGWIAKAPSPKSATIPAPSFKTAAEEWEDFLFREGTSLI